MKVNKICLVLLAIVFISLNICRSAQDSFNRSVSIVPIKQAKGRLKAIARGYMIENQKNTNPFELHQNWRFIKKDIYKKLAQKSYLDEQNQRVVNEDVMPTMTDMVFKKLVELKTDATKERRKKYVQSPDLIDLKAASTVVRSRLRKHGISINDKPILFKEIMFELKKYIETENLISKNLTKTISDQIIIRFKINKHSLQNSSTKSYLQEFLSGWEKRFTDQIGKQDWNVVQ